MTTGMQSVLLETLHKVPFPAQLSHLIPRIFVFTRAASSKPVSYTHLTLPTKA